MTVQDRAAAATAAGLTAAAQEAASRDSSATVRAVIAARADIPPGAARALAADPAKKVRLALASNGSVGADVLVQLVADPVGLVRWEAVQNPASDDRVHQAAIDSPHLDLVNAVGQLGDRVSPQVVHRLLEDPRPGGREQLALTSTDPQLLRHLAGDSAVIVRRAVAESRSTPEDVVRALATDRVAIVRSVVTGRTGLPEDVVTQLVHDRSSQVRWCIAFYRKDDRRALELLATDTHDDVRSQALGMLRLLDAGGTS